MTKSPAVILADRLYTSRMSRIEFPNKSLDPRIRYINLKWTSLVYQPRNSQSKIGRNYDSSSALMSSSMPKPQCANQKFSESYHPTRRIGTAVVPNIECGKCSNWSIYWCGKHQSASATMQKYFLIPVIYHPVPNCNSRYRICIYSFRNSIEGYRSSTEGYRSCIHNPLDKSVEKT